MSAPTSETTFDEYIDEQLINCLNHQTNVIRNLAQYSRHISSQLVDIRNDVELLTNRILTLQQYQQQQQQSYFLPPIHMFMQPFISPSNPPVPFFPQSMQLFAPFNRPFFTNISEPPAEPIPFSFSKIQTEPPSRTVPFVFDLVSSKPMTNTYDEVDDTNDNYEPSIPFKPVVQLAPVEVKTGEEDENILFCERAKLYRFDPPSNQMKERGIGEMKILQHKITNQCRVLMRRDQVFKVCANHKITSHMELKPHRETAHTFIWSAVDFADGEGKPETLCVKFKTNEQAINFEKVFNHAKQMKINPSDGLLSIKNMSLNDDDVIPIGELKPTKEQMERAQKLLLPPTFYLYESKQPCKGCRGCREDSSWTLPNETFGRNQPNFHDNANITLFENMSNIPLGFFPDGSLTSLLQMPSPWFPAVVDPYAAYNVPSFPKDQRTIIKAKRSLPSNRVPPPPPPPQSVSPYSDQERNSIETDETVTSQTHQKKTRNLPRYNSEPFSLDNYSSQMAKTIVDQVKQELCKRMTEQKDIETNNDNAIEVKDDNKPSNSSNINFGSIQSINETLPLTSIDRIFGSSASIKPLNTGFSFSNFANTTTSSTDSSQSMKFSFAKPNTTAFVFSNTPKLNFADIAKQASDNRLTTDDNKPRVFPGQGSLLFTKDSTKTSNTENDHNEDEVEPYEPTVSFKPIVHLSPVEVKTGEEDENIRFCERAKLYRFDPPSNQMKERGIGEMKILQHKTTNRCRVLMRRDQVFKVCANHRITSEIELKEHQTKENAYVWSAMDYSDGQSKHETLCVKFKTKDQAKRFYQQFNDAKKTNANLQQ